MSTSPTSGHPDQPPEKKKRRQNVACDSCRLRRVKCDMLALLTPADSTRVMPPLPVLVRQNPDISCSNCISKGIRCTTNQIVNPSKPNKGGKRIEEAKKMYGSEGVAYTPSVGGTAAPPTPSLTFTAPLDVPSHPLRQTSQTTTASSASSSSFDLSDPNANTTTVPTSVDFMPFGSPYAYSGTTMLNQGTTTSASAAAPIELAPSWTTEWNSNAVSTHYGTPYEMGMFDMNAPAATEPPVWDPFVFPPTPSAFPQGEQSSSYTAPPLYSPSATTLSSMSLSSSLPTLDNASGGDSDSSSYPSMTHAGTLDHRGNNFPRRSSDESSPVPSARALFGLAPPKTCTSSSSPSRSTSAAPSSQIVGKKRQHADEDVMEIPRGDDDNEDPWGLWSNSNKDKEDRVIRWSRSDSVGDSLASRALGSELSRHLVRIYFSSVHLTLPAISPEAFYMSWQQAGERSDRMSPAQEVLCAVIEAWAARFSDHPVVLGMDPNKPLNHPKLILDAGSDERGPETVTIDHSNFGRLRLRVCIALVERARKLIDHHGILRKPSVTGVQALALFTQLQHMTDHNPDAADVMMETEMLHTVLVHQLKRLDMNWVFEDDAPGFAVEPRMAIIQGRIKQRRMFWTVLVADAFWAAGTCSEPVITDEDVDGALAWLSAIDSRHMPSTFNSMQFFMGSYHRVACLTREVARKLSVPSLRPGRIDVTEFCNDTRSIWRRVRDLYCDINTRAEEALSTCTETILGFSPVHQFTSIRLATTYILLIMQQMVQQLLDFRRRLHEAYIYDDTVPLQARPEAARVAALEELNSQSIDILLTSVRAQIPLCASLMPTGLIQGGSMIIRILIASAQFLAEVPTNEQGYPGDTSGGIDWTWENKKVEVDCSVKALQQLGWAWADVVPALEQIKAVMVRQTPSPECLLSYAFNAQNISSEADKQAAQRKCDLKRDSQAFDAVLQYWPPASVPDLLGRLNHNERMLKQVEILSYGKGLFEHHPVKKPKSLSHSTAVNQAQPASASETTDIMPLHGLHNPMTHAESWAMHLPGTASGIPVVPSVPLPEVMANLHDLPLVAGAGNEAEAVQLSSELESLLDSLASSIPELARAAN